MNGQLAAFDLDVYKTDGVVERETITYTRRKPRHVPRGEAVTRVRVPSLRRRIRDAMHARYCGPEYPSHPRTCEGAPDETTVDAILAELAREPRARRARARVADPETSQQFDPQNLNRRQLHVYLMARDLGTFTIDELVSVYHSQQAAAADGQWVAQSPQSIRSRFAEIRRQGVAVDTGMRERTAAGRTAVVWRMVPL